MKYYVLRQSNASGTGSSTEIILIVNPEILNGAIKGIQVGDFDSGNTSNIVKHPMFTPCDEPFEVGYIGNANYKAINYYPFSKPVEKDFLDALDKILNEPGNNDFRDALRKLFNPTDEK